MFGDNNSNNINISESAAPFLTQPSPQSSFLSSSPPPQAFNQVSQALAMSLMNDNEVSNVDSNLAETWALANKAITGMSPNLMQFGTSPRGHSVPSQLPNVLNTPQPVPQPVPQSAFGNNIISGSLPSLYNLQQYNTATNTLINDLQLLNLQSVLNSQGFNRPQFSTSNIGNNSFQMNKQREQNPRKMRQQEQFSANKQRTIYISEIHHDVTEADLAILFSRCGDVVDVRLCGDAHSKMRFAFVEFSIETWTFAVAEALKLNNALLCGAPIRVQRSKTAIVPIKKDLLPQTDEEMIRCMRTIYVCNIDKRFTKPDVQAFFCGFGN
eukprot:TRINITY_DN1887_c0_g3_i4.p1 TRINITY_DN1887_c0_g3~~TRINITY_DN1887_c0_g3_i4.p1  ORF type:complete len:325 (-),score=32.31 TRINITY_DN1887_c0_g3_i4:16-990(-)